MILDRYRESLAIRERLIHANLIAKRFEIMNDISNDDFVRTGVIVVVADTNIDIRWIRIQ